MAERLAEDLWRLDIPLVWNPLKNLNSYLLTGERSLLIDTGFRQQSCREAMERQLAETHVDRDRLDIFCTHLHSDHTGLAPELIRPGCRIYIGEIDSPGVKTPRIRPVGSGFTENMRGTASPRRRWRPCGETIRPRRRPRPGGKGSIRSCRTARRSITAAVCCGAC